MSCFVGVSSLFGCRGLRGFGVAIAFGFLTAAARAEAPIWVIEDEDSTIYLFGTIHLLDPDIEWLTEHVMGALDEAAEVWFEIPIPATMEEIQAQQVPALIRHAFSPGRPLSSLLTVQEQALLARALARTPDPDQLGMALENMKPWFATLTLGISPLLSAGYDAGAGADNVLAGIAHARGVPVLGFETTEQQFEMFAVGSDSEQLDALRAFLAIDDDEFDTELGRGDGAFRAWMAGDTAPLEAIIDSWSRGENVTAPVMSYDTLVANRNEDWAGQIETLLAGEGVVFIAVGAGHLVGPDSLLGRLAVRGIATERL